MDCSREAKFLYSSQDQQYYCTKHFLDHLKSNLNLPDTFQYYCFISKEEIKKIVINFIKENIKELIKTKLKLLKDAQKEVTEIITKKKDNKNFHINISEVGESIYKIQHKLMENLENIKVQMKLCEKYIKVLLLIKNSDQFFLKKSFLAKSGNRAIDLIAKYLLREAFDIMAAESKNTIENTYLSFHKEIDKNWNLPLSRRKSVNGYPECFDNKYLNTIKYIRDWDWNLYRWVSYNIETKDYKVSWWIRDKFLSNLDFSVRIPNGFFWLYSDPNKESYQWYKSIYKENQNSVDSEYISPQNFPVYGTGTYYKNCVYFLQLMKKKQPNLIKNIP